MGRTTYEVAARFDSWPYDDLPVYVATSRPLDPVASTVRAVSGAPAELLAAVRREVDGGNYLDGGALIRAFLDEDLIDELTVTFIPVVLGSGTPLFAGAKRPHRLLLATTRGFPNGLVQLRYAPARPGVSA